MSTLTASELTELKDLINNRFDDLKQDIQQIEGRLTQVEGKLTQLEDRLQALEIRQIKIETRLEDWNPQINKVSDLAEKVGELKNWRQIALIVISATVAATLGWFIRGGNL